MRARFSSLVVMSMLLLAAACGSATAADQDAAEPGARPVDDTDVTVEDTSQLGTTGEPTTTDTEELPTTTDATTSDATTATTATLDDDSDAEDADDVGSDDAVVEPDGESDQPAQPVALTPVWPGDSGEVVVALQERLDELGFAPGPADGDYGGRTVRSVKAFQGLVGLSPTGWADGPTLAELETYRYDGLVLRFGDEGDDVAALQERLAGGPLDPGPADGEYGGRTTQAVWALERLAGIPVDGDWGPLDEKALADLEAGEIGRPEKDHDQRWVEVDLSQQLMKVYNPGQDIPILVSHVSSGSGIPWSNEEHSGSSVTPLGDFHIYRRISGWRESSLDIGRLYNPLYFNGGIALHGATSVPLYPASHGCIRLPMHIAEYLPGELPDGTPVHVLA